VSRGTSDLPRPAERFADSAAASGGAAASVLKTIAILALSLLLAAFGHGRRIWLPASRWRGLLGSRTDPPG
jgi:MYXO-CTERM domain-containing protein